MRIFLLSNIFKLLKKNEYNNAWSNNASFRMWSIFIFAMYRPLSHRKKLALNETRERERIAT